MEIMTKEGIGSHEYEIALKKFKEEPELNTKPEFEIRRCITRVPYSCILLYQILETGDVEIDKKEIKIVTTFGTFYCDYSKKVHTYLAETMDKIEKHIDLNYDNEEED